MKMRFNNRKFAYIVVFLAFVSFSLLAQAQSKDSGSWDSGEGEPNNPASDDRDGAQSLWQDCMQRHSFIWYILNPIKGVICLLLNALQAIFKLLVDILLKFILSVIQTVIESFLAMINELMMG